MCCAMGGKHILAYVGLGSNSVDAQTKIEDAKTRLQVLPDVSIVRQSALYLTEPQGFAEQPWFTNQVIECELGRQWNAPSFLAECLAIETALGRVRDPGNHFGPRTIDIDLLLFDTETSDNPFCIVPHPRMCQRAFVLVPLMEIAPHLQIGGEKIDMVLARIEHSVVGRKIYQ